MYQVFKKWPRHKKIAAALYAILITSMIVNPFAHITFPPLAVTFSGSDQDAAIAATSCTMPVMYAIDDIGTNDSQLFSVDMTDGSVSLIGSEKDGYDIEAIDVHPTTGVLYGLTGDHNDPQSNKRIVIIDPITGIPDLNTGVQTDAPDGDEYSAASFHPVTGALWVSGDNVDIRTLDIQTGQSTLQVSVSGDPDGLAWNADGTMLYISYENGRINAYNPNTNTISQVCEDVGTIEGLEFDTEGNLVIGYHHSSSQFALDIVDINSCQKTNLDVFEVVAEDVETMTFACMDTGTQCGNGIKEAGEQCDGTDGVGTHQQCSTQCTLVELTYCGDGIKQSPNDEGTGGPQDDGFEACDGTDGVGTHQSCSASCELVDEPFCGDGIVNQSSEQCDDGNFTNGDGCSDQCLNETDPLGSIAGCIYHDVDNDSDPADFVTETKLSDWTVTLTLPNSSTQQQQTVDGCYLFTDLVAGEYTVVETVQSGWTQTYPDPTTITVTLAVGQDSTENDFANYREVGEPMCGNNIKEAGEQCDGTDGVTSNFACNLSCQLVCVSGCGSGTPQNPHLEIEKTAAVTTTQPGNTVGYTIVVINTGQATARNVIVNDVLPSGLSYATTTGQWQLGDLAAGERATLAYDVLFSSELTPGGYQNIATVTSSNANTDTDDAVVTITGNPGSGVPNPTPGDAVLDIVKVVDRTFTNPGGEAVYTVTVTNISSVTATNVILTDRLPKGFYFEDNKSVVHSWLLGDIVPQQSKTVSYTVKVAKDMTQGTYENIAAAKGSNTAQVFAQTPIEVRDVVLNGFTELPDTNGASGTVLATISGLLLVCLGWLLRVYRSLLQTETLSV